MPEHVARVATPIDLPDKEAIMATMPAALGTYQAVSAKDIEVLTIERCYVHAPRIVYPLL
jgi:hypothetical protein